ncbi:MAG TPA: fumarylacetoacetate hydrolase family protein [Nitriliruptorales bacterium]|nr:fumarylacetoacetate hydrolase family protein [Nitriliruptorales bacterium]
MAIQRGNAWVPLVPALQRSGYGGAQIDTLKAVARDLVALLGSDRARGQAEQLADDMGDEDLSATFDPAAMLPFAPRSFRDFSLWETHMLGAAKGIARLEFSPPVLGAIEVYERVTGKPFPRLRPGRIWYENPIYYIGNHLTFHPDGATIPWPAHSQRLDYELELGLVIASAARDAGPDEGLAAVGGFVVVNDVSARDVQHREMTEGRLGPVKSKGFASAMGSVVVTPDEILPRIDDLTAIVRVNGEEWSRGTTAGMQHSLGEMVAYASMGEPLSPGELLATGTVPGCCGLEIDRWVRPGDTVELELERVGTLTNVYEGG